MSGIDTQKFNVCYNDLRDIMKMDYSLALDVFKCFHDFLADILDSEVELVKTNELPASENFGASVKIDGAIPFVIGIMAGKKVFHEIAERYEHFKIDTLSEDYDAVSELLNVFTGHFIIKISSTLGIEEELEPPRFGRVNNPIRVMEFSVNVGTFYLYIGREEIFESLS